MTAYDPATAMLRPIVAWCKSLSTRLLALTAMWVTFIVGSICYTMALGWYMQDMYFIVNTVTTLPAQVYRANVMVNNTHADREFTDQINRIEALLARMHEKESWNVILLTGDEQLDDKVEYITREWQYVVRHQLEIARTNNVALDSDAVTRFISRIDALHEFLDSNSVKILQRQRTMQFVLMILAIGSLFVIMWLLITWVIRPTEELSEGIDKITDGKLDARVNLSGSTEFENIGSGFNRMADRLQDLVDNLEAKVKEKTESAEERNRNLSQLYEISSYFALQHSVDDMSEGFTARMTQYGPADACALFFVDSRRKFLRLASHTGLSESMFTAYTTKPVSVTAIGENGKVDSPVVFKGSEYPASIRALDVKGCADFGTGCLFDIRNGAKTLGFFVLYWKEKKELPSQFLRLFESFGAHFGVAVENLRYIERDQQFAVVQERNLMAQGLHDSIAQSLAFLNMQVQLLESGLENNDKALIDETVGLIRAGVNESYEDVRELLLNFRERLHKESFEDGLATVIDRFEIQTKLKVDLDMTGGGAGLTDRQKLQVIFILQEALANVRKHSKATAVKINITNAADFVMTVTDNGVGIDIELVKKRNKQHVGLNIMNERSDRIGANVTVDRVDPSIYPSGTTVRLVIPSKSRKEVA